MDVLGNLGCDPETALVILSFLQAEHRSAEYGKELLSLGQELTRNIHLNGCTGASEDDGHLETDGSRSTCVTFRLDGPEVQRLGEFRLCVRVCVI